MGNVNELYSARGVFSFILEVPKLGFWYFGNWLFEGCGIVPLSMCQTSTCEGHFVPTTLSRYPVP